MEFEQKRVGDGPATSGVATGLSEELAPANTQFTNAGTIPPVAPFGAGLGPSASERAFEPIGGSSTDHPTIRVGSNGPAVMDLQRALNNGGEQLAVDGAFGPATRAAVTRFQHAQGLEADGVVGRMTWKALDAVAPGADVADMALGDAEVGGGGDDVLVGGDDDVLAINDGGAFEAPTGKGPAGPNTQKQGPAKDPKRPPPVQDPAKASLMAGTFADMGQYRPDGTGFVNATLDALLAEYGVFWSVDVRAVPAEDKTAGQKGADSAGKGVSAHPPWVKALQNKIIGRTKWDDDDRATQKMIESFLRAWTRSVTQDESGVAVMAPGVEQLFHQIGESETNGEANSLTGFKGASSWCAAASTRALLLGLYNRGIRFKDQTHSSQFNVEMQKQTNRLVEWENKAGHVTYGSAASTAPVQAGDIITVVNGGAQGPLSGHIATVVRQEGDKLVYVSGNASGVNAFEGAVRVEEVKREPQPAGYNYAEHSKRGNDFATFKGEANRAQKHMDKLRPLIDAKINHLSQALGLAMPEINLADIFSVDAFVQRVIATSSDAGIQQEAKDIMSLELQFLPELSVATEQRAKMSAMELDDTGLPTSRDDPRFKPGRDAPVDPASSWVTTIVKSSALTQAHLLASGNVEVLPADAAVERGPLLKDQCKDAPDEVINKVPG